MRGLHKVAIGLTALALAAGAVVGTQLLTHEPAGKAATATPAPVAGITPYAAVDTIAPTTTEPPPPPPPPPPVTTTAKPKPKPTTTAAKPKPRPPAQAVGAPCSAAARACVDLSANRSWLLDGAGHVIYGPVPITSGRPGYRTPTGTFRVQWKDIDHKSTEFDNAPMPYSVFFVGGIAFHAGSLTVQSHGCIHLSTTAAQKYYNTLRIGDIVQVVP